MRTLDEICNEHGTDKGSAHEYAHHYARHYEKFFWALRDKEIKFLEIGVGGGQSIKAWLEYFPAANVHGVDNVAETNYWNTPGKFNRYTFVKGDQSDDTFWKCFIVDYGVDWDVVIDDGGHFSNQIITTFHHLWPVVRPGGLYCIEDLGVAYGPGTIFNTAGHHMDFLRTQLDALNQQSDIDSIYFCKELAIIKKAGSP